jgi:hypothetical protein
MIRDLIGVKYKPHGRTIEEGLDCRRAALIVLGRESIHLPDVFNYDADKKDKSDVKKILERGIPYLKLDRP